MQSSITAFLLDLWHFGLKQANAAAFGGLLLAAIFITKYATIPGLTRFDTLFILAVTIQIGLIVSGLEEKREIIIIAVFHILATVMEVFKTSPDIGSWSYQGEGMFMIGAVPLFAGFMYSAVGSYLARVWRIFDFSFTNYPLRSYTLILAALIYLNFISHHFIIDIRLALFAAILFFYGRTMIYFTPLRTRYKMPLLLGFFLVACFIFFAENIATFAHIWLYPNQINGWQPVPLGKLGSWYLLLIVSFVLVSLLHRKQGVQ